MSKATEWAVRKRDGRREAFDAGKIEGAVEKCLVAGLGRSAWDAEPVVRDVSQAARRVLAAQKKSEFDIEEVQRTIIQMLWAKGEYEAAEHFTIYREKRRLARESRPVPPHIAAAIAEDASRFSPIQYFMFLDKYARWLEGEGRRETWRECCDRVIGFFRSRPALSVVPSDTWDMLREEMFCLRAGPAMRVVQMAGPALERCNSGGFNCTAVAVDCLEAFDEALYLLMQGCGVGFSVESDFVDELPRIKKQSGRPAETFVIPDSTEGWCRAYRAGMLAWFNGRDVEYAYDMIRPEGSVLKTKGGRASGYLPLKRLLDHARAVVLGRQGKKLRPIDAHDIMCLTGDIVAVGGVRRAAMLSLSDLDDAEMRDAKSGAWWERAKWRSKSNNSAVYDEPPTEGEFMAEWHALMKSGSGERGVFNRHGTMKQIPKRRKKWRFLLNPCAEILLRSGQMCNLSIAVARPDDTDKTLLAKVRTAAIFGTLQATLTDFKYLRPVWKQNCDEERLLGVDITGSLDCPLLRPSNPDRRDLLKRLAAEAVRTNEEWADRLGIPRSAAATCVKPSGNSAQFFGCSSGLHPRWSRHQIRRMTVQRDTPLDRFLRSEGVPFVLSPYNDREVLFEFLPEPPPDGTPVRDDMSAMDQFRNWLDWKECYTEHNPSCSLYVKEGEWMRLGAEVFTNFSRIGGLSFFPHDGGTYAAAPNEELTEEKYRERLAAFPKIDWAKLVTFEDGDRTAQLAEPACAGGACET